MSNKEAVNWLINILADIGKAEHSDLWHYEQALTEIKDMLESAQLEERKESLCKKVRALCEESKIEFFFVGGGESTWSVTNNKHIKKIVECHKAQLSQEDTTKDTTTDLQPTCDDAISRKAVKDLLIYNWDECCSACIGEVEEMPPVTQELLYRGAISLDKQKILQAGYEGREYDFYIGGRLFSIREKAQ